MYRQVKKAVFPVAGLGTRFLPATKASPKEMLPVVDKPLIQYAVEEAVAAGIEVMIFITGRTKQSIADHFDKAYELETELEQRQKYNTLATVRNIVPADVACVHIRQAQALGLGHAVLCAKPVVGDEPFAVILADDLIDNKGPGCIGQMVDVFLEEQASILGVERVAPAATQSYGIVKTAGKAGSLARIQSIVEKPRPEEAPSNLGVVGRYILTPSIFDEIESTGRGAGGEIQLTDAIAGLLKKESVYAYEFEGTRYDCGSKLGYLIATVEHALQHQELKDDFRRYLMQLNLEG
ncbi:MAG: UTP--glucose-1-phosphate uridylyltransferase GalU [Methylococcaceae bacterium]|nr:UTP--glucose-1-phosphate uridylyltransferase GalU [Methylococcaceae bacterium]